MWNLATAEPTEFWSTTTSGGVEHLEVTGSSILWSVDEPLNSERPDLSVGVVYLCNTADASTIAVKKSADCPYTHPFGEIRSFKVAVLQGVTFIITGGGEGTIRTWRFDAAKNSFDQIMLLEGHVRAVTCIHLRGRWCLPYTSLFCS